MARFKAISLWGRAFPIELEFGSVGFCGGRKTGEPGEKPLEQEREPTTNSIVHQLRSENLGSWLTFGEQTKHVLS